MTKIEWCTKPGYKPESWNPATGCDPISEGCANCYAQRYLKRGLFPYGPEVTLHPERLDIPLRWRKPRFCFCCSMSDLFHDGIDFAFVDRVMATIALAPQHIYVFLTKRPERMKSYFDALYAGNRAVADAARVMRESIIGAFMVKRAFDGNWHNLWLGVTAENQQRADERIPILLQIPAAVRFVSVEPMLGPVDLEKYLHCGISWCIIGAESGPNARPMEEDWVRSLICQCKRNGTAIFYKQKVDDKKKVSLPMLDGKRYAEYP